MSHHGMQTPGGGRRGATTINVQSAGAGGDATDRRGDGSRGGGALGGALRCAEGGVAVPVVRARVHSPLGVGWSPCKVVDVAGAAGEVAVEFRGVAPLPVERQQLVHGCPRGQQRRRGQQRAVARDEDAGRGEHRRRRGEGRVAGRGVLPHAPPGGGRCRPQHAHQLVLHAAGGLA